MERLHSFGEIDIECGAGVDRPFEERQSIQPGKLDVEHGRCSLEELAGVCPPSGRGGPFEGRRDVRQIGPQPQADAKLADDDPSVHGRQPVEVIDVTIADVRMLSRRDEPVLGVRPHRIQYPEPDLAVMVVSFDERLGDQRFDDTEGLSSRRAGHRRDRVDVEPIVSEMLPCRERLPQDAP